MATSDDRRLIDNESSTTVDKFYGNKGGKDVQIPLADAAAVLAGAFNTALLFPFMERGRESVNMDNITKSGTYTISDGCANRPPYSDFTEGTLMAICFSAESFIIHFAIRISTNSIAYRCNTGYSGWTSWKQISTL